MPRETCALAISIVIVDGLSPSGFIASECHSAGHVCDPYTFDRLSYLLSL